MSNKAQLYQYKGNKYSVCGMSVQEMIERFDTFSRMFELHHIDPEKKDKKYDNLIRQKLSSKQIDELDKCTLLCRNCHGLVHAQDQRVTVEVTVNYSDRVLNQKLSGWLISDNRNNSYKFLCEEKLLIERYDEQLGSNDKGVIFGLELDSGERFLKKVKALGDGEIYSIWSPGKDILMLRVTKNGDNLKIEFNVRFSFIKIDGSKLRKGNKFWYRNGVVLYENGEVQTEGLYTFHLLQSKLFG